MNKSDLSKLELFLKTLPEDKKTTEWDERYINDVKSIGGSKQAKEVAIKRNRYVNIHKLADGYDIGVFENYCTEPVENKCHSCCDYSKEKDKCIYDPVLCTEFFVVNVTNWDDITKYHISFLKGETPGTPDHPGPWDKETEYILDPLVRILQNGILTMDSQPGLFMHKNDKNTYIQKPYIKIGGPVGRIHRILIDLLYPKNQTLDNTIIKYVPHKIDILEFNGYKTYQPDGKEYVVVYLGIDTHNYLMNDYVDYVFSNRFFNRIADVIEKVKK